MLDVTAQVPFEAIVLAGGLGTRLKSVVKSVPKVLAPVAGKPFIDYILENLWQRGCKHAIMALGYCADMVINHVGDFFYDMRITYSVEECALGTGGAIKQALNFAEDENVIVLNGDTFFDVDFIGLLNELENNHASLALALREEFDGKRYGTVQYEDGYVRGFYEKSEQGTGLVCGGVYAINRHLLDGMPSIFSFEKDFEEIYVNLYKVKGVICHGYFIDIGIPQDYRHANDEFALGIRKAAFFDRDGTINIDTTHLFEVEKLILIDHICSRIKEHNDRGDFVCVATNQAGIAKGLYSKYDMSLLHNELNFRLRKEYDAHIDAFHYCPHHPDYTGACDCRKPLPGLLFEAAKDHHINLAQSYMYGDKKSDEVAALSAGLLGFTMVNADVNLTAGRCDFQNPLQTLS